ncbi:uncharacterized protein [Palaemon carinicauda]
MAEEIWDPEVVRPYLEAASKASPPAEVTLEKFKEASYKFNIPFPVNTARISILIKQGKNQAKLTEHINSTHPVIHENCVPFLAAFLHFKKNHGTTVEKSLYQEMDLISFVDRLLCKRPVTFFAKNDQYLLRDRTRGSGGFEKIGTNEERPPLCLKDYLSYDEIKVSALVSVSSESSFINNGSRRNKGVPGNPGTFQEDGVIVGMVGARLKKVGFMEWQDCMVTGKQNRKELGYGSLDGPPRLQHIWSRLWGSPLPEWRSVTPGDEKFLEVDKNYLNIEVYKKRMQLGAETLLAEAKSRARAKGQQAYIHVVGLGLGVWRASHEQDAMFVDAWGDALKVMDTTDIAHVDFSWIGATTCLGVGDGEIFPGTQVVIHFSKRSLHDPVPSGTLLVVNYAWDGNSLPGNEYWIGKLASTGDGAAACSSGVAELHNVHINSNVCGTNLHVAGSFGIMHIGKYSEKYLSQGDLFQASKKLKC